MQHAGVVPTELGFARTALGQRLLAMQQDGSRSNRAIAEYLVRNPLRITALGIEELAAATGVSAATLSRFARALGYSAYPDLRAAVADAVQLLLKPVEKLRSSIERTNDRSSPRDRRSRVDDEIVAGMEAALTNARVAAQGLDARTIQRAVATLTGAREVFTLGFGLSAHLAALLALDLQPFCDRVTNVVDFGGTEVAAGRLMSLTTRDVLLVISFPRYAADAIRLANFARDAGAKVIAVTDSPASPLATTADQLLFAPAQHPVLSSSLVSAMVVIEAIVVALMLSNPDNVRKASKLTQAISAYLVDSA